MSERPWTPGPWLYRPLNHDDWGIVRSGYHIVAQARAGRDFDSHSREANEHRENNTDPFAANARLIAAAPELFELLVKAREHVGPVIYRDGPRQEDCERCDALLVEIDAALAKAKGQE